MHRFGIVYTYYQRRRHLDSSLRILIVVINITISVFDGVGRAMTAARTWIAAIVTSTCTTLWPTPAACPPLTTTPGQPPRAAATIATWWGS